MLTIAVDATPLVGERTGIGRAVSGLVRELAASADLSVVGYGLTAGGWRRLRDLLPQGLRASRGPMPAGALLRLWSRADVPPVEWWTGRVDVVHGTNYVVPPVDRARVRVIPPGIDPPGTMTQARPDGPPYILGLGRTEPRKDFPGLVAAFERIASSHPELELRIAGPAGWGEEQLRALIGNSPYRERIKRLGWVGDPGGLIGGAEVFAYPSLYEGFGYPPLEAMSLGVPVVATSAGAVPEVAGDAALIVEPGDPDALAGALEKVVDDSQLRAELVEKGRERVEAFTWDAAASAMRGLYSEIASRR